MEEISRLESYVDTLLNPYANYVVQKALECATPTQRERMLKVCARTVTSRRSSRTISTRSASAAGISAKRSQASWLRPIQY